MSVTPAAPSRMTMKRSRALIVLALAAGVLSTAACDLSELGGDQEPQATAATAAPPAAPTAAPLAAPTVAPAPADTDLRVEPVLRARAVRNFGTLVTDARGMVLYRSDRDSARPSVSRCAGACTKTWIPALANGDAPTVAGIDPTLLGSVRRAGGVRQLTLAGWPVYTFAKDRPGQVLGQCKAGFFAITPEGGKTTMNG